jgi:hypothetical protein
MFAIDGNILSITTSPNGKTTEQEVANPLDKSVVQIAKGTFVAHSKAQPKLDYKPNPEMRNSPSYVGCFGTLRWW